MDRPRGNPNPREMLKTSKPHSILPESIFHLYSLNWDMAQPNTDQPVTTACTCETAEPGFHLCFQGCLKTSHAVQDTQLEKQLCPLWKPDPGAWEKESFLLTVLMVPSVFSCQMQSKLGGWESASTQLIPQPGEEDGLLGCRWQWCESAQQSRVHLPVLNLWISNFTTKLPCKKGSLAQFAVISSFPPRGSSRLEKSFSNCIPSGGC